MNSLIKKKIIIGTAHFGEDYGILKKKKVRYEVARSMLRFLDKNDIRTIDTSSAYINSEKVLGKINIKNARYITKILPPSKKLSKEKIKRKIKNTIKKSLKRLKIKKIYAVLLHDADCLTQHNGKIIYETLNNFKKKKIISKIGISIYDFKILKKILNDYKLDIIQAPYNIFDRRIENKKIIRELKKRNVKIHARSIFLQGILLKKELNLPKKISKLKKNLIKWKKWLRRKNFTSTFVSLGYVASKSYVDKVVVGFDKEDQLKEILNLKKFNQDLMVPNFINKNNKITNPINWK